MPNPKLLQMAAQSIRKQASQQKQAVQPPPPDPSMGGGAPPPGGDPSMGGGAPPMDPSMGGGAPPPPPPSDPSGGMSGPNPLDAVMQKMDMLLQTMQQGAGGQAGPGGSPNGPGKPGKPDLLAMSMDIFQMKKYLFSIGNAMGIEPPAEIMDGPNRDPSTGAPMMAGQPGSTSDPATMAQQSTQPGQTAGKPPQSAIKPIDAMQGAMPTAPKTAQYNGVGRPFEGGGKGMVLPSTIEPEARSAGKSVLREADALAAMFRTRG